MSGVRSQEIKEPSGERTADRAGAERQQPKGDNLPARLSSVEDKSSRVAEIRDRVSKARDKIASEVRLDGNRLVIGLTFEDEGDLANAYLQAVADCNSLLCILDGGTPI